MRIFFKTKTIGQKLHEKRLKVRLQRIPTAPKICKFIKKVHKTGFTVDAPTCQRARTIPTQENIDSKAVIMRKNPSTLTSHRFQELNQSPKSLRRILRKDLNITPYKVQLGLELKPRDNPFGFSFAKWSIKQQINDVNYFFGQSSYSFFEAMSISEIAKSGDLKPQTGS